MALTKPRVMTLAIFTACVGMAMAPGELPVTRSFLSVAAIATGAGAAGALNMWYDAPLDAKMARTAARPLPSGRIGSGEALAFGLALSVVAVGGLAFAGTALSAALLAGAILFYAVVYTMWLKYATAQNIVIGGAAGALPPVIGWAAVTGTAGWQAWLLFLIIFLWTPPHFWALALLRSADYAAVRIPMLPVVAGEAATRRQILAYALVLVLASLAPWAVGLVGPVYGAAAITLGGGFLHRAWKLHRTPLAVSRATAKSLFAYSIFYLYALFAALWIDVSLLGG
jgi:heme o synthase